MAFVNLSVETQLQVFDTGTVAGNWKFWVIGPDSPDPIAGPQQTPNESIIFFVDSTGPTKDQVFTAYAVRVNGDDDSDLGPIAEAQFTLSDVQFVILRVAKSVSVEQQSPPEVTPT